MTDILQNLKRWVPRWKAIQDWEDEHDEHGEDASAFATIALEKAGKIEDLTRNSFSAPVNTLADAIQKAGRERQFPTSVTDDVSHIVESARPLLEQHKDEIFAIYVKCLTLEFSAEELMPLFAEVRMADRNVPWNDKAA